VGEAAAAPSEVLVVSDGTGETATAVVRAAMLQFQSPWRLRVVGGVRREVEARRAVREAASRRSLLVFTLVDKRVSAALLDEAEQQGVVTVDLLGPLISRAAQHLRAEPRDEPGLLHGFSDEYFRRVDAVEFAVRHDDGANLHTLFEADLVLTGVSRTSKTPLSMYLAQRGYKTGNVPLVPGLDPPRALLELDRRKVFALLVDPSTLVSMRKARLRSLGRTPYLSYAEPEAVGLELERARRLVRERGWRSLDVSGRAVEENASRILQLYREVFPGG
jgi:regulator of PEP synthase PpsR (kinase-PPPase family)